MKTLNLLIVLVSFLISISCHKENNEEIKNINVDKYIELLKSGKYDSIDLPAFSRLDIPALLAYRNETQKIMNFPAMEFHPIISMIVRWDSMFYGQLNQSEQLQ